MKKMGDVLMAAGFIAFLIFGSALDGPDNNMALVYSGCIASMAAMWIGFKLSEGRKRYMGKYIIKNFSTLTDSAAMARIAFLLSGNKKQAQENGIRILVRSNQDSTTYTLLNKKPK